MTEFFCLHRDPREHTCKVLVMEAGDEEAARRFIAEQISPTPGQDLLLTRQEMEDLRSWVPVALDHADNCELNFGQMQCEMCGMTADELFQGQTESTASQ